VDFKFEPCKGGCNQSYYLNKFQICNMCSSENEVIDNFLSNQMAGMKFIHFNRFKDVEFIAEGGFSKIYKATWINNKNVMTVVLKELNNSKDINSKELNEVGI
jgi:hypothetical protein